MLPHVFGYKQNVGEIFVSKIWLHDGLIMCYREVFLKLFCLKNIYSSSN